MRADATTLAGYVLATDGPVVCDDLPNEDRVRGRARSASRTASSSAISTVIRMPGRRYGVLGAYTPEPRAFGDDDIVFARNVANLLGAWFARREVEAGAAGERGRGAARVRGGPHGLLALGPGERRGRVVARDGGGLRRRAGHASRARSTSFLEHVHPDDREQVTQHGRGRDERGRAVLDGAPGRAARTAACVWLDGRGAPVRGADGEITGWIGVGIDITERKQVEDELRDRELEMRLALGGRAHGHRGVGTRATGQGIWSPELEDLVGIERGSYDGTWDSFIAPILVADGPLLRDAIVDAARDAATSSRSATASGAPTASSAGSRRAGAPLDDGGEWIGVSIDVTDRREAEEALREANDQLEETVARLDTLLANAPLGFAFFDQELPLRPGEPAARRDQRAADRGAPRAPGLRGAARRRPGGRGRCCSTVHETGAPISDVEVSGQTPAQPGVERHWLASYYPVRGAGREPARPRARWSWRSPSASARSGRRA